MHPARLTVLIPALGVAACGGLTDMMDMASPPPSRPQAAVADEVAAVDRSMLVGTWQCRELNPYPDQPPMSQSLTFGPDGAMRSAASIPMGEQVPGGGTMRITAEGRWDVAGGDVVTSNVEVDSEMVGGDARMAAMMDMATGMTNAMIDRTTPDNADVLRLTADELVLRGSSDDAPVLACTRA